MNYLECIFNVIELNHVQIDIMIAKLYEFGFDSFEHKNHTLHAYIAKNELSESNLVSIFPFDVSLVSIKSLENRNWNSIWESNFNPVSINDCYIRAPFHQMSKLKYDIVISPNMSFGTGHHPTTQLMIKMILSIDFMNKRVLDVGSGTGVLSILADKKNASHVIAIDIDQNAYRNTIDNVSLNKTTNIKVFNSDVFSFLNKDKFDILLVNINKNTIKNQFEYFNKIMSKNGIIILSGFLDSDFIEINKIASINCFLLNKEICKDGWKCVMYKK